MPALKDLFFPSSYSRNSPKKRGSSGSRQLTRQPKLRHVTDRQLGLNLSEQLPADSPVPQPLPRPEFRRSLGQRGSDWSFSQRSKGGVSKGKDDRRHENANINSSSLASDTRSLSPGLTDKTTNHPTKKSEKSQTYFRRGIPLSLDDESVTHNFRLNVPARSAPTSPLSSPVRSPQRFNSVNFVPSTSSNSQFLYSSTPKESVLSSSGRVSPSLICQNGNSNTPDHSPLHSPKLKCGFQNTNHHNLNTNHHNLHPLPLPPLSPKRTQSPTSTNTSQKPEASSTKGQWIKDKLIGRGTYGSVFEAVNSETGAMCAMKEVDIMLDDPKSVECIKQLEQEIKILQHLENKNIVRYYGCEVVEDRFCIFLEYVHPGSINKYVREHFGAITESVVRNFTRHILSGLAYLHSTNTVHRDVKGANLLVDASGVVKIADFGLAKHLSVAVADLSLKGSPHWMAPELLQAVMRKDFDHQHAYAVDIWSLGCTVIEMFNGKPPWSECTGVQALFNVMHKSPAIPESLSSEGKDFLNWCFKRDPAERPLAAQLLKHPFVRTTQEQGFSTCALDFSGIKLSDASCSSRVQQNIYRSLPTSPRAQVRQMPSNGGSSNGESSRAAPHQSPRSTLDALSSISSPELGRNSPAVNLFTSPSNKLQFGTGYDYQNITRKARKGFSRSFGGL